MAEWEGSIVSLLNLQKLDNYDSTKDPLLNTHSLIDPCIGAYEGGCIRMSRGGGGNEGEGQWWLQIQFIAHHGSMEHGSLEEVRLQPSHYSLEHKMGRSNFSPRVGISFPHPIAAE